MVTNQQSNTAPRKGLYSAKDFCERADISRSHLSNLRTRRAVPAPVVSLPRFVRWAAQDVENWIADPAAWLARDESTAEVRG